MFNLVRKIFLNDEQSTPNIIGNHDEILMRDEIILSSLNSKKQINLKINSMKALPFFQRITLFPILMRNIRQVSMSYKGLDHVATRSEITSEEFEKLIKIANKYGAFTIGFTQIEEGFSNNDIAYSNVIVFAVKMDKEKFNMLPSHKTIKMIENTSAKAGIIANKITKYLRKQGFGAQAGSELEGFSFYPFLAERAGIGAIGRHGYIITPEVGPRHKLGVIYTNIENLPFNRKNNPYSWIKDYCKNCGKCVHKCPVGAIKDIPIDIQDNQLIYIDREKCLKELLNNYGCRICLKECVFNTSNYKVLKVNYDKKMKLERVLQ